MQYIVITAKASFQQAAPLHAMAAALHAAAGRYPSHPAPAAAPQSNNSLNSTALPLSLQQRGSRPTANCTKHCCCCSTNTATSSTAGQHRKLATTSCRTTPSVLLGPCRLRRRPVLLHRVQQPASSNPAAAHTKHCCRCSSTNAAATSKPTPNIPHHQPHHTTPSVLLGPCRLRRRRPLLPHCIAAAASVLAIQRLRI